MFNRQMFVPGIFLSFFMLFFVIEVSYVSAANNSTRVWVEFEPGNKDSVEKALNRQNATFHYTFNNLNSFVVTIPQQALTGISNNPNVVSIENDVLRYLFDTNSPVKNVNTPANIDLSTAEVLPWGVDAVQAPDVWNVGQRGAGVTACIIDTGLYTNHVDMTNNLSGGMSQVDDNWQRDGFGHGTHVAGTIAALDNEEGIIGVSPDASLYIVKIFDDNGNWAFASDLVNAINTCADNGANIISMSLGGSSLNGKERRAFQNLFDQGILHIAAAGNDGNTAKSYPASYDSVISVAATDINNVSASFSQQNDQVELSAPGVEVISTLSSIDDNIVTAGETTFNANHIENAGRGIQNGLLINGGFCESSSNDWSGKIALCERGNISFNEKVQNAEANGAISTIIFNNEPGNFFATLGDGNSSSFPAVSLSRDDGLILLANSIGTDTVVASTFTKPASGYEAWNGTSMATPHVSAVAALLWSSDPTLTNIEIRDAMNATALDLGTPGRDNSYGNGLVQANNAIIFLSNNPEPTPTPPAVEPTPTPIVNPSVIQLTATGTKVKGVKVTTLTWEGGNTSATTLVNIFRDGAIIDTVTGVSYIDNIGKGKGSVFVYDVCEVDVTTNCSNLVEMIF